MADIDPNDYKPMSAFDENQLIITVRPEDLQRYLVQKLNLTPMEIQQALYKLEHWKPEESTFWQKMGGYIYYGVLDFLEVQLTPKRLAETLSKLDQIIPYLPAKWMKKLVAVLDKVAEVWLKSFDK